MVYKFSWQVLPPACICCDNEGVYQRDLCQPCFDKLPHNDLSCSRCGLPTGNKVTLCGACLRKPPPFDGTICALRYEGEIGALMQRFKYGGKLAVGRVMTTLLETAITEKYRERELPKAIIPVPSHWLTHIHRGFNQTHEIARQLSKTLDIPVNQSALTRKTRAATQTSLNRKERLRNLQNAFTLKTPNTLPNHVAIIDDVVTTGATASTVAHLLKSAAIETVDIWALARTPKN